MEEDSRREKNKRSLIMLLILIFIAIILLVWINNKKVDNNGGNQAVMSDTTDIIEQDKNSEITEELDDDNIFCVTDVTPNDDDTYTLRGVFYTKLTLTEEELEDAVQKGTYEYYNVYDNDPKYVEYKVKKDYMEEGSNVEYDYAFIGKYNDKDVLLFIATKKDEDTYYIQNTTEFQDEWKLVDDYKEITVSGDIEVENDYENIKVKDYFSGFESVDTLGDTGHPGICYTFEFSNGECSKIIERPTGH